MTAPEVDSLWIDNDPRTTLTRYVLVTGPPDGESKVPCISWYDVTDGTHNARPSKNRIKRFQPQHNGNWSHSGFRPAEAGPALGYPYGYGPDADQFTGSDA